MNLEVRPYKLALRRPFRLATGSRSHTDTVILKLTDSRGVVGYGEASLPPYLGEDVETALAFLQGVDTSLLDAHHPRKSTDLLAASVGGKHRAGLAAINIALNDIAAKRAGVSISARLGIAKREVATTYTIGHSSVEELREKLVEAGDYGVIKLKLGSADDRALLAEFRRQSQKPFCVDVNQGWRDFDRALEFCRNLFDLGCLFVEQPFAVGEEVQTARLRAASPLPIIADESVCDTADFKRCGDAFDGVNVKLMKSRGIDGALDLIDAVRAEKKHVVVGCMAESSCAVTAAAHISPLADWADLDGPLLINNDPFEGIGYRDGKVVLPERVGLGVREIS